ncbi:hypothetical protein P43SY_001552 [Pythium insidiosum]|uniref:Uncharacterized protein n=1 Tax=Pythium insidiosum TaxID=114742 RepID=A0AAD5M3U1_PYTIN|nr:hypothetical protein P43SY_001552 [Pythium insidiosum]
MSTPRRDRVRSLLLAAAKARAAQALTLPDQPTTLFAPYSPSPPSVIAAVWAFLQDAALGIEIDPLLVETARRNVDLLPAPQKERIVIKEADILRSSIVDAKIVIVYAFAESLSGIRDFECQGGSHAGRIVSTPFVGTSTTWIKSFASEKALLRCRHQMSQAFLDAFQLAQHTMVRGLSLCICMIQPLDKLSRSLRASAIVELMA